MEKKTYIVKLGVIIAAAAAIGAACYAIYYDGKIVFDNDSVHTGNLKADNPGSDTINCTVKIALKNRGLRKIKIDDIVPSCSACTRVTCPDVVPAMGEVSLFAHIEISKYRLYGQTINIAVKSGGKVFTFEIVVGIGDYYSLGGKYIFFNKKGQNAEVNVGVRSKPENRASVEILPTSKYFSARIKSVDDSVVIGHADGTQSALRTYALEIFPTGDSDLPSGKEKIGFSIFNGEEYFSDAIEVEWNYTPDVYFRQETYFFTDSSEIKEITLVIADKGLSVSKTEIGDGFSIKEEKNLNGQKRYFIKAKHSSQKQGALSATMSNGETVSTILVFKSATPPPSNPVGTHP